MVTASSDLVNNAQAENRYGYEEVALSAYHGSLPNKEELDGFLRAPGRLFDILRATSTLKRSLCHYHGVVEHHERAPARRTVALRLRCRTRRFITPEHEIDVAISMLARLPAHRRSSHTWPRSPLRGPRFTCRTPRPVSPPPRPSYRSLRSGMAFTRDEAMLLDVMLMLHAEHGGGNNSTFACRVLSSSATDPYSAYAAAIGRSRACATAALNAKVVVHARGHPCACLQLGGRGRGRSLPGQRSSTSRPSTARVSSTVWATPSTRAERPARRGAVTRANLPPRRTWAMSSRSSNASSAWHRR